MLEALNLEYYNKVGLMLLVPLVFLFVMSRVDLKRTKLLLMVFFSNKYFYRYPVDTTPNISLFNGLGFGVNLTVLNLLLMFVFYDKQYIFNYFFTAYLKSLSIAFLYLLAKYLISEFVYFGSNRKESYKQMFILETSYLTSLLLVTFFFISYGFLHLEELDFVLKLIAFCLVTCYLIRAIVLINNNKNLLGGKLFYIILYLCTLELVPFVYLFKHYLV